MVPIGRSRSYELGVFFHWFTRARSWRWRNELDPYNADAHLILCFLSPLGASSRSIRKTKRRRWLALYFFLFQVDRFNCEL